MAPVVTTQVETITMTGAGVPVTPSISTQPASQAIPAGQTATFSVTASGAAPLSYQWKKNGTIISGANSPSYTTSTETTSDSGTQFSVVVSNSAGSATSNAATLTVNAGPGAPLQIATSLLANAQAGMQFQASLSATGGVQPYVWSVTSGALPSGLTLASNGTISGTPTASAQSSSFTVKVTDSSSPVQSASSPLSISITSGSSPLSITTTSLPSGMAGSSYSSTLIASGGTTPYSWVVSSGNLPSGLTLASSGTISGTPSASAQSSSFTVRVTDSSSPVQSASGPLSISIASGVTATPGATATQYVMSYTAANSSQCTVEVSTSPTYNPLVQAVDPTIFANANLDGQTKAVSRAFVVGQKWIAQEDVAPPSIAVGGASRGASSKLVTVNFANQPFVAGDNITITGMSNAAYNDPWARVNVASTNSFSYEVLTAASAGGDSSGGGTIRRANRYSLALAADTTYFYRIGGASNTCGASPASGTFTTMNIPNGNVWEEGPLIDNNGVQLAPTILETRGISGSPASSFIDALTGATVYRVSLFADSGGTLAATQSSAFYRTCSLTTSSNGFYHCWESMGSSGIGGLYSFKSTGEVHWLGLMKGNYTDSLGNHCCNSSVNPYISGNYSAGNVTDANVFYGLQATNAGNIPFKNVVTRTTFTGNDAVDAASGALWNAGPATALTPDPLNTLDDKMAAYAASDPYYSVSHFHGCVVLEAWANFLTGNCNSFDQGSPAVMFAFNTSSNAVVAMGLPHENQTSRWCGSHGTIVDESSKWIGFGGSGLQGNQTGEWHAQLSSPVTNAATSFSVTSPLWVGNTAYSNGAAAGFAITDSKGNLEVATTAGTTNVTQPTWPGSLGGTVTDGTMTWTNEGATSNVGEPQNIYAFKDQNGKYYSFLMPAAGAVSGGGEFNGDLFIFEDGTNECVRLITKGSVSGGVATWSLVTRAVHGNSLINCISTPVSHSAGAVLRALCEDYQEASARSSHYWDFVDDPHMTDTTGTYYVRPIFSSGHGYARETAPHGGIWNTFGVTDMHDPFVAADFASYGTMIANAYLTFNGIQTGPNGVSHNDYTTWDFENASFKNSAIGSLFYVTGGGPGGYGTYAKIGGTNTIHKYVLGNAPFNRTIPYVPTSGGSGLPDISGPSSLLTDTGTNQVCITVIAGECWAGSSPGDMYASLSQPVSGSVCNSGNENQASLAHDWCMQNTSMYGDALNQYGLVPANFIKNDPNHGVPEYGAGLSRRLAMNALGGMRLQGQHPHTVPDGSSAIFESCIADPHLYLEGTAVDQHGCQVFATFIPPQPPADGIDRTNYENVSITIGPGSGGATHARVKYGYEENERMRGTTWPPAIHFYCTQYQGTCYSSGQNLPLSSLQTLPYGVPQRVLFYQVEYLNGSNQVVASDPITTLAIP